MSDQAATPQRPVQKIPQPIKAQIPGYTTIVLANGDIIILQPQVVEVFRLVGQKDAQGKQAYEVTSRTLLGRPDGEAANNG